MERHLSAQTGILNIVKKSKLSEVVNFMCQLDWSHRVPRYLVKHYSGCFCRVLFHEINI